MSKRGQRLIRFSELLLGERENVRQLRKKLHLEWRPCVWALEIISLWHGERDEDSQCYGILVGNRKTQQYIINESEDIWNCLFAGWGWLTDPITLKSWAQYAFRLTHLDDLSDPTPAQTLHSAGARIYQDSNLKRSMNHSEVQDEDFAIKNAITKLRLLEQVFRFWVFFSLCVSLPKVAVTQPGVHLLVPSKKQSEWDETHPSVQNRLCRYPNFVCTAALISRRGYTKFNNNFIFSQQLVRSFLFLLAPKHYKYPNNPS